MRILSYNTQVIRESKEISTEGKTINAIYFKNAGTTSVNIDGEDLEPGDWFSVGGNKDEVISHTFKVNCDPADTMKVICKQTIYIN
jgi:hypothetical protein